jgi:hypothetical protein
MFQFAPQNRLAKTILRYELENSNVDFFTAFWRIKILYSMFQFLSNTPKSGWPELGRSGRFLSKNPAGRSGQTGFENAFLNLFLPFPVHPNQQQLAGQEHRRIGAGDNAQDKRQGKVFQAGAGPEIDGKNRQKRGHRGVYLAA